MSKIDALQGKEKAVRLTVSIPPQDYEEIQQIAENAGVSYSWVIRKAVKEYIIKDIPLFKDHLNDL